MKTYEVVMTFTYTGTFLLNTDSRKQAQSTMEQNSNMELTRDTMETINSEGIDWQFEVKPLKAIINVLRTRTKRL